MNNSEKLIAAYPYLHFIFDANMPAKQKGLCIDDTIYLNPDQSQAELLETISEEIAHYETSVGDITAQQSNDERKQEKKARNLAATRIVTLDALIECYELDITEFWEIAEYLEVTSKFVVQAILYYKDTKGIDFTYQHYRFQFGTGDSLLITKIE